MGYYRRFIKILLCLALFSVSFLLLSADDSIQAIEKKLTTTSGNERIAVLNELSSAYLRESPEKALEFGDKALHLARELKDSAAEALALRNIGQAHRVPGRMKQALACFKNSLDIYKELKDDRCIGDSLYIIGTTYFYLSDYNKTLEYFLQSYETRKRTGDKKEINNSIIALGVIYGQLNRYEKALGYFLKALEINEEMENKAGMSYCFGNIGIVYRHLQNHDMSIKYLMKSLKIEEELGNKIGIAQTLNNIGNTFKEKGDYMKALEYHQKSLRIKKELHNRNGIAASLNCIGDAYISLKNYPEASRYFTDSLQVNREIGSREGEAIALNRLGIIHIQLKEYDRAEENLRSGVKIAEDLKINTLIMDFYGSLSDLYAAREDYRRSLEHLRLFRKLKDEILNKEANDKIAEMQAKDETEKKEKEIILLQKNNEILAKDNKIRGMTRNVFIAAFALVLIIALLLFKKYLHLFAFWKRKSYIGHYHILDKIGSGGMGIVYKASHVMAGSKPVAIKVIREEYSKDPTQRKRFLNEALLVDQLNHPNIVKVFERGEHNEQLFIAMELLEGQSLAELIQEGEHIPLPDCLKIMAQIVDAVSKIHSKGIVHRDLKPENILLVEQDGEKNFVKLLDFGLAKSASLTRLTETGEILGTINYLPPERISRQEFSPAGDIYSLGVVFYEMVTREKPFLGETPLDVIKEILDKEPVEPIKFRSDIPTALNDLILKMMNKEPAARPSEKVLSETIKKL